MLIGTVADSLNSLSDMGLLTQLDLQGTRQAHVNAVVSVKRLGQHNVQVVELVSLH